VGGISSSPSPHLAGRQRLLTSSHHRHSSPVRHFDAPSRTSALLCGLVTGFLIGLVVAPKRNRVVTIAFKGKCGAGYAASLLRNLPPRIFRQLPFRCRSLPTFQIYNVIPTLPRRGTLREITFNSGGHGSRRPRRLFPVISIRSLESHQSQSRAHAPALAPGPTGRARARQSVSSRVEAGPRCFPKLIRSPGHLRKNGGGRGDQETGRIFLGRVGFH